MNILNNDCLVAILTTRFTYREQYLLACVCKRWYNLITGGPDTFSMITTISPLMSTIHNTPLPERYNKVIDMLYLLANPHYRILFIVPPMRALRNAVIRMCFRLYEQNGDDWPVHKPLNTAILAMCAKIDNYLIFYPNYWKLTQRRNPVEPADVDLDMYQSIFG